MHRLGVRSGTDVTFRRPVDLVQGSADDSYSQARAAHIAIYNKVLRTPTLATRLGATAAFAAGSVVNRVYFELSGDIRARR